MDRSKILTTIVCLAVPIIGLQFWQNSDLKSSVEKLEVAVEKYQSAAADADGLTALGRTGQDDPAGASENGGEGNEGGNSSDATTPSDLESAQHKLGEILTMRDPTERMAALMQFINSLEEDQLSGVLKDLRDSTPDWDPDARVAVQLILTRWGKADPEGALEYLAGQNPDRAGGDAATILGSLASSDPQRAIDWLEDPENKFVSRPWMGRILAGSITKEWVRHDPEAALAWAMETPDNQRSGAYTGVLGSIAAKDPQRAATLVLTLPEGDARSEVVGQIVRTWAKSSAAEALQWAADLEGGERERAMGEVVGGWAKNEPRAAAEYVESLPEDEREGRMIQQVANNWANKEPGDAAEWLGAQPDSKEKTDSMGHVMWQWTNSDPEAASTWLLEQPEGDTRDRGINSLAHATFESDPEAALSWAAHISDDQNRSRSVSIGINAWHKKNPEAAMEWLNTSESISNEEAQKLIQDLADK